MIDSCRPNVINKCPLQVAKASVRSWLLGCTVPRRQYPTAVLWFFHSFLMFLSIKEWYIMSCLGLRTQLLLAKYIFWGTNLVVLCLFSKVSALCCSPTKSHLRGFSCLCIAPPHSLPFVPVQHVFTQASPTCHQVPDKGSLCPLLSDLCTNVTSQRRFPDHLLYTPLSPLLSTVVKFASSYLIDIIAYIYLSEWFNCPFNPHFFQMRILWFCLLHGSHLLVLLGVYFIFMTKNQSVST